jgi:hypothetical protein
MSLEKLYSINSELNNMFGGEMIGGDGTVWAVLMLLIFTVVGIILYLSGILSFNKPKFISNQVTASSSTPVTTATIPTPPPVTSSAPVTTTQSK